MSAKPPKKKRAAKQSSSGAKRQIPQDSQKGRVAAMMLQGTHTFGQIAKKIGTTTGNALQHAKQLAQRGFPYEVVDGKVKLRSSEAEVFAAKPAKKAKRKDEARHDAAVAKALRKVAAVEPEAAAEPAAPKGDAS